MTSKPAIHVVLDIVTDLAQHHGLDATERYSRLLRGLRQTTHCDAAALLRLRGSTLHPLAVDGLSLDTLGRRFAVDEQPRLAKILLSREPVRFLADSELPDPYDGLIETSGAGLHVHDCLGVALYLNDLPWGILTLDALHPGTFDTIDPVELRALARLTETSIRMVDLIDGLRARAEREHLVAQAVVGERTQHELLGDGKAMRALRHEIDVVTSSDLSVLITGETGVGKELVARHVHAGSKRHDAALVYVNCAALPENLVESELFGHAKGAFSGASEARTGKFELADGGTLFLDEIGEMPLATQPKLLRALQSGEVQRVGSDAQHQVDVRILAATNRDLAAAVTAGTFRSDLYHRLSVYPIVVPALRERGRDVLLLAGHFLEQNRRRLGLRGLRLDPSARHALLHYAWPGNVRELEHTISRAVLRARADRGASERGILTITPGWLDLPGEPAATAPSSMQIGAADGLRQPASLREATAEFQRRHINASLQRHGGNRAQAARELGVDRGNFSRLLKRLELS